jgi:hypothetical protein
VSRFVATPTNSKHRIFVWLRQPTLPDHQVIAFAHEDDYFFSVLHSRVHEVWAHGTGTQLREAESGFRYTPTECFPFIGHSARSRQATQPLVQAQSGRSHLGPSARPMVKPGGPIRERTAE